MLLKYVTITTAEALYAALGMSIIACIIAIVLAATVVFFEKNRAAKEEYILSKIDGVSFEGELPVYECPNCGVFFTDCANTADYLEPHYCPTCGSRFQSIKLV